MRKTNLLWIDCTAAAIAGTAMLLLSSWLSALQALPQELLQAIGIVNLVYAAYSFSLARRLRAPRGLIHGLVVANLLWALTCLGLALHFWSIATFWGIAHLVGEALFVGGLSLLEWRSCAVLSNADVGDSPRAAR